MHARAQVEDEVRAIVDKAKKEMSIEKTLADIATTWRGVEFQFERHPATGTLLVVSDAALVDALEDNQLQLQNVSNSKHVEHFRDELLAWQRRLQVADHVIGQLLQVQRTWTHLHSIFVGSDDIRAQLPEDAKRFERIDADFRELQDANAEDPGARNVLSSTSRPGLADKLEDLSERRVMLLRNVFRQKLGLQKQLAQKCSESYKSKAFLFRLN